MSNKNSSKSKSTSSFEPKSLEIDQDVAKELFKKGGIILMLDVPKFTEIGIDYNAWDVGEKFKGIKFVPAGLHFIYFSARSRQGGRDVAPRTGYFEWFEVAQTHVKQWYPTNEEFINVPTEQADRYRHCIREFDPFLGTYPLDEYGKWLTLTKFIGKKQYKNLSPESGIISSVQTVVHEDDQYESGQDKKVQEVADVAVTNETATTANNNSNEKNKKDQECKKNTLRFTKFELNSTPRGIQPQEMTKYALDKTWLLEKMLCDKYNNDYTQLLGEYQFSFVCFLIGQCFDAFEHWKRLTALLCSCDDAISKHGDLYFDFIDVLYWQLKETPADFFVDIISKNNFLVQTLHTLLENISQERSDVQVRIKNRIEILQTFLMKRFGWDFTIEPDDELPVVVDL